MPAKLPPTRNIHPLILGSVYRLKDAADALGLGKNTVDKLKREGLRVRRAGNKDYVISDDLWDAMIPVSKKQKPQPFNGNNNSEPAAEK